MIENRTNDMIRRDKILKHGTIENTCAHTNTVKLREWK